MELVVLEEPVVQVDKVVEGLTQLLGIPMLTRQVLILVHTFVVVVDIDIIIVIGTG